MSTSVNKGNQVIVHKYREEARAKIFNRLLSDLLPLGIYSGLTLTRLNDTQVALAAGTVIIKSPTFPTLNISPRIETTASQTVSLESSTNEGFCNTAKPYIVLRFYWSDQELNYMDMLPVGFSDDPDETDEDLILSTDIVVGKVLFEEEVVGSGDYVIRASNAFDYTRRGVSFISDAQQASVELRVSSSETNTKKVYVSAGSINTSKGRMTVAGGDYPSASTITDTTTMGRWDLVYVDEDGAVKIVEGTPSADPEAPLYLNRKVIAEIHRGAGRTDIIGPDIHAVNVTRQGQINAANFPIEDAGNYYTTKTIEAAFQEIYELYASILGGPGISDDTVKDYHIDWGTASGQVSAVDVPIADALNVLAAANVEAALAEIAGSGRTTETLKNLGDAIVTVANALSTHEGLLVSDGDTPHDIEVVDEIT